MELYITGGYNILDTTENYFNKTICFCFMTRNFRFYRYLQAATLHSSVLNAIRLSLADCQVQYTTSLIVTGKSRVFGTFNNFSRGNVCMPTKRHGDSIELNKWVGGGSKGNGLNDIIIIERHFIIASIVPSER